MNSLESNIALVNSTLQHKKRTFHTEIGIGIMMGLVGVLVFRYHQKNKLKNNSMYTM